MPPLRQEVEAGAAGLDPGRWPGSTCTSPGRSTRAGCPGSWWPSHAAAASPI